VLGALKGISADAGQGSAGRRQSAVARLLRSCRWGAGWGVLGGGRARPTCLGCPQVFRGAFAEGGRGGEGAVALRLQNQCSGGTAASPGWGIYLPFFWFEFKTRNPAGTWRSSTSCGPSFQTCESAPAGARSWGRWARLRSSTRRGQAGRGAWTRSAWTRRPPRQVGESGGKGSGAKATLIGGEGPGSTGWLGKERRDAAAASRASRACASPLLPLSSSHIALIVSFPPLAGRGPLPPIPPVAAFHTCPNLGLLASALLEVGPSGLASACALRPGVPVQPMLANPATGVAQALKKLGRGVDVLAEMKYDGKRAQIHVVSATQVRARLGGVGVYHVHGQTTIANERTRGWKLQGPLAACPACLPRGASSAEKASTPPPRRATRWRNCARRRRRRRSL
jgi:hypothetical protein